MAASRVAPGVRLVAARRFAGLHLVGRPRSGVAHLYAGTTTKSGAAVPAARRAVCRAATRRLTVLDWAQLGDGRRVCRRCLPLLPAALGRDVPEPASRDDRVAAFSGLTIVDLTQAAHWTRSVDDTHQVQTLAMILHGSASMASPVVLTGDRRDRRLLHDLILERRTHWRTRERTAEERAAAHAVRDTEVINARIANESRRREVARETAQDRARSGKYIAPWERTHLAS